MAIQTTYNAKVMINTVDLSSKTNKVTVNDAQETKPVRVMGTPYELARPGYSTPSFEITFYNDHATGTVEPTLRALVSITSTGVPIYVRWDNTAIRSASNQEYYMDGVLDGDLNVMDDEAGELPMISASFKPYATFTVLTSAT
jgi:hypothetical protein